MGRFTGVTLHGDWMGPGGIRSLDRCEGCRRRLKGQQKAHESLAALAIERQATNVVSEEDVPSVIIDAVGSMQVWQVDARQLARLHPCRDVVIEMRESRADVVRRDISGIERMFRKCDARADRWVARAQPG
jgi:hypothetical protein